MTVRPPVSSRNRLPWLVAAVCAVLLVATVVSAVVVLSGGKDDSSAAGTTTTYQPGGPLRPTPGKYKPGKVANSCDALDFSATAKLGFPVTGTPVHQETDAGTTGSLECVADLDNGALTGQASYEATEDPEIFEESKTSAIQTPPADTTSGAISGLGSSAYFTVEDRGNATSTYLTAVVEAIDENLSLRITFKVTGSGLHTTREEVRKAAEDQAHTMLDRLR
ncbi:hypothetical protein GPX89_29875 [Nocardia sp. ET3-3]|uniref:DUF3558 domain-containing protein n=1 Tax=Nocardia terrae TaxID=2675851 RepID=A0A7K1V4H7_9NOCA|nr:hypothetical protein [Nocardia terrae]MVU81437.1 hypothetical protein [Nocardia terrae]